MQETHYQDTRVDKNIDFLNFSDMQFWTDNGMFGWLNIPLVLCALNSQLMFNRLAPSQQAVVKW